MKIRPDVLLGETHKLKMQGIIDITIYLTVNMGENGKPYEVFFNTKNAEIIEHLIAVTLLISKMLQENIPINEIADCIINIASPFTSHMKKGGLAKSMYARIGETLMLYCKDNK